MTEQYTITVNDDTIHVAKHDAELIWRLSLSEAQLSTAENALRYHERRYRSAMRRACCFMALCFFLGLAGGFLLRPLVRGGADVAPSQVFQSR